MGGEYGTREGEQNLIEICWGNMKKSGRTKLKWESNTKRIFMEATNLSELPNKLHLILVEDIPLCLILK
jgi:hypothetical protein